MIYINARFLTQKVTGVQRFAIELSRQLVKILGERVKFVAPKNIIQFELAEEFHVQIIGTYTGYLWEQVELPRFLNKQGVPVLLNFCSVAPLVYKNNIVAIHDITFVRYPKTYSCSFRMVYNFLIPHLCKKVKHVLTVSKFSLEEITNYYKVPKEKFSVVYNAVDGQFRQMTDEKLQSEKYFVAVSSVKENKNFPMVVESFKKLQQRLPDAKLYIIGDLKDKNFGNIDLNVEDNPNIILLGRVSDEDLIRYYSNAVGFIFPSYYEGFGIPVLEAQACGCPVISTNRSSLPEVLLDSAILANPDDVNAFADGMYTVATDTDLRSELIRKGFENVKRFSWEDSARKIVEVITEYSISSSTPLE